MFNCRAETNSNESKLGSLPLLLSVILVLGLIAAAPWEAQLVLAQDETADVEEIQMLRDLLDRGEYEESEELLSEEYEEDASIFLLRARLLRETGRASQALEELVKSEHYTSGVADVLAFTGQLRLEQGKLAEAEKDFRRALESDAKHIAARTQLGLVLQQNGCDQEGQAGFRIQRSKWGRSPSGRVEQGRRSTPKPIR